MSAGYETIIGLEIHVQLSTRSKLFCGCAVDPSAPPNSRTDPVCLGLPGVLPVLNEQAARKAARLALALGCEVASSSEFARKHYFYPDLPKNFQITQFERPLARGGAIEFELDGSRRRVRLERIHMEEDAGRSIHDPETGRTLVDLNRAGTPLVEVVTLPELRAPEEAGAVMTALRALVRWLDVGDANMELGQLRCDANLSVRRVGDETLGPKVEIKNLNSMRHVVAALRHEARRQIEQLVAGETVRPQTRGFDPRSGTTFVMREKEESADYRYFVEPDLPPLVFDDLDAIRSRLPELPLDLRARFVRDQGLDEETARVITESRARAAFFEAAVAAGGPPTRVAAWMRGDLLRLARETERADVDALGLSPAELGALCAALERGELPHELARSRVEEVVAGRLDAASLLDPVAGLDDREFARRVAKFLDVHPDQVESYRAGRTQVLGWLLGRARQDPDLATDPRRLATEMRRQLEES